MDSKQLEKKHKFYDDYIEDWKLFGLVYESGRALIDHVIYRHPRETVANYKARVHDAYIINFAQAIIDIYNFYVTQKEVSRDVPGVEDDEQWKMFLQNADLMGTDYNIFLNEAQKLAAIHGAVGILVNRPPSNNRTVEQEIRDGIYPYCCMYTPENILDWKFQRNLETHRMELVYLKLYDGDNRYLIWTKEMWELWEVPTNNGMAAVKAKIIGRGQNLLGEVPFVFLFNCRKHGKYPVGESDIKDISRITISIVQNCSSAEEVIKFAGFPIMREPMEREGMEPDDEVPVGPTAVKEFDPSLGAHSKPDWMPTEILEPIDAILKWMDRKVNEIYRMAHLSGIFGQRVSENSVSSGLALRYQFSQLNTVLVKKSENMNEADFNIVRLWLKWQNQDASGIRVIRNQEFSIDELSVVLDNSITMMKNVLSKTFRQRMQEKMVKASLPTITQEEFKKIMDEIDKNTPEKAEDLAGSDWPANSKKDVRPADQAVADHSGD